ncbi:putative gustatory receptor 28b [Cotesia glomerata]|uniref:putative gustatory receptor 28b n=1 Tax=Cotesia glomerata TaxID=32391 RepID=UPI001D012A39|nr:putative gustatory receptor 28b [Cotesia glomerata]
MDILTKNIVKAKKSNWQLFTATNYTSLMYPIFMLCKINGLFPYKVTKIQSTAITNSRITNIYSAIVFATYIVIFALIIYYINVSGAIKFARVPAFLQAHCYLSLGCFMFVVSLVQSNSRVIFYQKFNAVTLEISPAKLAKLSKIIHIIELIGVGFLLLQFPSIYSGNYKIFLFRALAMHTTFIIYCIDKIYINHASLIGVCFTTINENLYKLKDNLRINERHLLRRNYHKKWNPLLIINIQQIIKQHNNVSKLTVEINEKFGLQMIASVTLTFIEITFSLYFYILRALGVSGVNIETQIWFSYFVTSMSYYTIKLLLMVIMCEECRKQSRKTGIIVHEILNETKDKEINDELQIFSLQLLHHDTTFTVKGLKIDATLLTSFAGGITTYFLILIQFLMSSKSCAEVVDENSG